MGSVAGASSRCACRRSRTLQRRSRRLAESEPTTRVGHRILIVDDNYDGAESLAMLLEEVGHETYKAHDGIEALERPNALRPDAVLLDIGLPKLNGYEVCRRIRERPWGQG